MSEYGLQLFQFQRRGYPEHAFAVEAAVRDENMAVRVEAENIAEGLDGDDCAGNGILFRNDILEENLQRFPGTAAGMAMIPRLRGKQAVYNRTIANPFISSGKRVLQNPQTVCHAHRRRTHQNLFPNFQPCIVW